MDNVRVLRIIEYTGPRDMVEEQIEKSIHGTRSFTNRHGNANVVIRAVTIGAYPEILGDIDESSTNPPKT